jgi:hypothetical protein
LVGAKKARGGKLKLLLMAQSGHCAWLAEEMHGAAFLFNGCTRPVADDAHAVH